MAVLERSELEASPLADLHTIANQVGLDGFRRLRKADLIDAILGEASAEGGEDAADDGERPESAPRARRRRPLRSRRSRARGPQLQSARACSGTRRQCRVPCRSR